MEEERDAIFVAADEGIDIEHIGEPRAGHRYRLLGSLRGPNPPLEPVLITLTKQSEVFPPYQHQGAEFLYMLEGEMEYGYGTARYVLAPGDALQFEGDAPHGPVRLMDLPIRFLSIKAFGSRYPLDASRPRIVHERRDSSR
ncbi:MAG: cupin domain-containing protein [Acidimicrobiia bacterium]